MSKRERVTLNLPLPAYEALVQMAEQNGVSLHSLIREYLADGLTIDAYMNDRGGTNVVIELEDGTSTSLWNKLTRRRQRLLQ